ncbi:holin [Staphylococcus phage P68]|uniref:Holin n=1 Tax=Staphylococcus phage 44AHJD TaxID=204086 RepID=Q859L0_BP44A|nr:holin [Staphylococcus phage phi44AHJD]NP_817331.1 holin [Staphylococcus phage P68]AAO83867.1 holin [Staphylococcus phage phi44AHJD]AAO83889.1 holin [Staphylococcus phage P68]
MKMVHLHVVFYQYLHVSVVQNYQNLMAIGSNQTVIHHITKFVYQMVTYGLVITGKAHVIIYQCANGMEKQVIVTVLVFLGGCSHNGYFSLFL